MSTVELEGGAELRRGGPLGDCYGFPGRGVVMVGELVSSQGLETSFGY